MDISPALAELLSIQNIIESIAAVIIIVAVVALSVRWVKAMFF